jgi:raffinose/stachyose/melibiose transport system substrate-binding protein
MSNATRRPRVRGRSEMVLSRLWRAGVLALLVVAGVVVGCGGDDDGGSASSGGNEKVTLSFLVGNADQDLKPARGLVNAFHAKNPNITIKLETRPQGSDGDNIVKTRLSTQDMTDIFQYNSGSLFQALKPEQNLQPVTDEPFVKNLQQAFLPSVSANKQVYAAPFGTAFGGGILYNKKVYERLGLQVPKTWDEFMANNAKIKKAGVDPVIQSYGETWTSQLFVLADYHNVKAQVPDWDQKYTHNQAKYVQPPALEGFQHLEEVKKDGYLNKNFGSIKVPKALSLLAEGKGAHYPQLTVVVPVLEGSDPDKLNDVGFFAQPGTDASKNGLTLWLPGGIYIPRTTEGAKLDAAKKFLAFASSPEGCDAQAKAFAPTGPFMVKGCQLPASVPAAIKDLQPYVDEGKVTPALEFLSPVKGPALEQITVEVGSGLRNAQAGAKLYDEDVKKQAQQLGLEGW